MPTNNEALAALNELHQRSMLTGVPTAEYNAALSRAGFSPDQWWEAQEALQAAGYETGRPTDANVMRYGPEIARTGTGNLSYAPGSNVRENLTSRGLSESLANLGEGENNYYDRAVNNTVRDSSVYRGLQGQYNTLNTNYINLQNQLNSLQAQYDAMRRRGNSTTGTSTTGSSGVVSDAGTTVDGNAPAGGSSSTDTTMGVVYGPDGTMYSSPAAARAAGVFSYTRVRPTRTSNPATTQTANPSVNASPVGFGGGLINNVVAGSDASFFTDNAAVGLPTGVRPAF